MRFFSFLTVLFCAVFCAASAQASDIAVSYYKDASRTENFQSFISKLDSKKIKLERLEDDATFYLDHDHSPYWIVLNVRHANLQEPLTLYFGNTDQARSGFANSIILFNRTSGQTLINSGTNKYFTDSRLSVPFATKADQQFILYIDPNPTQSLALDIQAKSPS